MDIVERLRQGAGHLPDDILDAEQAMDWAAADIEKMRAEIERLRADKKWLTERLRDAVNTCYGGVTHDQIDACSFEQTANEGET